MMTKQAAFSYPILLPSQQYSNGGQTSNTRMSSVSPKLSRRALLAVILSSVAPSAVLAYSSPYRPSQTDIKPLPDRLYEAQASAVKTLPSGLQYFDLSTGSGGEASEGSQVSIYYTSRLRGLNGIKLDSSYEEKIVAPFSFRVGDTGVVKGVSEMVVGMRVGGKRRAVLPPDIAYTNADMSPKVKGLFAKRRLLSVLETNRDATIVFEYVTFLGTKTRVAHISKNRTF